MRKWSELIAHYNELQELCSLQQIRIAELEAKLES
jgi:hypothetical protein